MKKKTITAVVALAIACTAAGFTTVPHKVNYDLNGGSVEEILPDHASFWQTVTLPDVTKIHEIFTGWIDENNESVSEIKFTANDISLKADFVPEYYSVRLMNEDGSVATTTMRKYGQTTDLMKFDAKSISDTHPYEDIVGWTDKYHNATITTISAECARDVELYPVFEPKKYSISYELNGGTNASNPETYKYGTGIESFADPYRDGYTFTGWFSDPECTSQVTSISADSHEDIVLYAGWKVIPVQTYTPTYSSGSGSHVSSGNGGNTYVPANINGGVSTSGGYVPTEPTFVLSENNASIPQIGYLVNLASYWDNVESSIQPYIDMANTAVFKEGIGDNYTKGQMLFDHAYQGLDSLPYRLSIGAECTINWNGTSKIYHYVGYTIAPNPFRETAYAIQSHALTIQTCVGNGNNYYVFFD